MADPRGSTNDKENARQQHERARQHQSVWSRRRRSAQRRDSGGKNDGRRRGRRHDSVPTAADAGIGDESRNAGDQRVLRCEAGNAGIGNGFGDEQTRD